jgi:hypothetical protein
MNLQKRLFRWRGIEGLLQDLDGMLDPRELPGGSAQAIDRELAPHSSQQWKAAGRKE